MLTTKLPNWSLPKPPSPLAAERLRNQQFIAMARWSGPGSTFSVSSCIVVLVTFWSNAPHVYLLTLLASLLALHALAITAAHQQDGCARLISSQSSRLCLFVAVTGAIGLAWASAPISLLPHATPDQRPVLICLDAGLASMSILLAPLLPAALLFLGLITLGGLLPLALPHPCYGGQNLLLMIMYSLLTCGVVASQGCDFARRVLNEATLEKQTDIIGLLLREFEAGASDFLWETDAELRLQRVSERLAHIVGCDPVALRGASILDWVMRSDVAGTREQDNAKLLTCVAERAPFRDLQIRLVLAGQERWLSMTGKPVMDVDGSVQGYRGVGSDVTAVRRSDERIAYLARHDSLTNLPNRALFQDALVEACGRLAPFALLCLDLDGFKAVNDTLGHAIGDRLLIAVADRLRSCLREGDIVARLGGDEFAVLQKGGDEAASAALAQRLIEAVAAPYEFGGILAGVGLSIGVALPQDTGITVEELLKGADLALYHSKAAGRGVWHRFEPGMALRAQARHALQAELRHAIGHGELILDFQPIVDLSSGDVTGAEALVRWLHPARGRIPPADFIPAAEESGLIIALGEWVLRSACQEAASWAGLPRVAVNLSPVQFRDPGLLTLIDRVLDETGLPGWRLELEITESVFLDALDTTVACLHALRARGIHIALDDFGTGYSSLSYLRSFPFDRVKIDQSFIRDLGVDKEATAIIQAIVGMADSLGMRTTAEGVETRSQAKLLQLTGCSQVQGYLFGRPCPPEAIGSVMRSDQTTRSALLSPAEA